MSTILRFQLRLGKTETKRTGQQTASGDIVIFTGVRYERIPEISISLTKSAKKTRKTA
jgi:hypothetical protein